MKKQICLAAAFALLSSASFAATVDGDMADEGSPVGATQSEPSSFGSSMRVDSIHITDDANNVYIGVAGDSSFNNAIVVFINIASVTGDSPAPVPATAGGGGALNGSDMVGATLELAQIDYGFAINSGDNNAVGAASSFLDAVDYVSATNVATYLGSDAVTGTVADTGSTVSNSWTTTFGTGTATFAYSDGNNDGVGGALNGFEISIPKSLLGITGGTSITAFAALTGGSGFFSSSVLPPVTGQGASNIGTDPNFTILAGTQIAGPVSIGAASVSDWTMMEE